MVLKLVLKDFAVQRNILKRYLASSVILAVLFWILGMKEFALGMAMFPVIYGFLNGALYADEKNNTLRTLVCLPVRKEQIVYARYISVFIMTAIVTAIFFIYGMVAMGEIPAGGGASLNGGIFVILMSSVFMIMISIYLPLAFKLGYIKAAGINRFVMIAFFGAVSAFGVLIGNIYETGKLPLAVTDAVNRLSQLSAPLLLLLLFCASMLIYFVSMKLSVRFFKARDLFAN
ncbi:ABC-2 family transporter [Anaerobacterium chartisolvens]|uniref:ABC-2 family transporter n=1 Tax=Anaerobacterium chartisolvens TaxID=1297424 RepID=A0A369BFD2_9FIRM|nr:ABC-2 transporter permease [Anaerobacterium chartisolvens]RCX19318.1 ABC-2 family transporter [Anaerobacterium chartisolvens]